MISKDMVNKITPILKGHQVLRASIFGSFAMGTQRPDSDLDLRVQLPENGTLFDFVELKMELEEALGRKVDLISYGAKIHPVVLAGILKEEIPLF